MAIIKGTKANDTLTGVAAGSTIYGLSGNDLITTVQNTTTPSGLTAYSTEIAYGGAGNDTLTGVNITGTTRITGGRDKLFGDAGNDSINGNGGNDALYGGAGNDTITMGGNAGHGLLFGGAGNDSITGSAVTMTQDTALAAGKYYTQNLAGGDGNDTISGGTSGSASDRHILNGGNGDDSITAANGSVGINIMYGGAGNDTFTGSNVQGAKDYMYGGAGADVFNGGWTDSTHNNAANETISYVSSSAAVTISLAAIGTAATGSPTAATGGDAAGDLIYNVNNAVGSKNNDSITGNIAANKIDGGNGNDTIYDGGTSASTMTAATATNATNLNVGNDSLSGGNGNDTIIMHNGNGTAHVIDGGVGTDTLDFSNVVDNATAGAGGDIAAGSFGLQGNTAGGGTLAPGGYVQNTVTGVFVNLSSAVAGTNNFEGSAGQGSIVGIEKVIGTGSNDFLVSAGNATMDGGAGNDTIVSAQSGASDILLGGIGNNVYDGTGSSFKDYFGVGNMSNNVLAGVTYTASASAQSGFANDLTNLAADKVAIINDGATAKAAQNTYISDVAAGAAAGVLTTDLSNLSTAKTAISSDYAAMNGHNSQFATDAGVLGISASAINTDVTTSFSGDNTAIGTDYNSISTDFTNMALAGHMTGITGAALTARNTYLSAIVAGTTALAANVTALATVNAANALQGTDLTNLRTHYGSLGSDTTALTTHGNTLVSTDIATANTSLATYTTGFAGTEFDNIYGFNGAGGSGDKLYVSLAAYTAVSHTLGAPSVAGLSASVHSADNGVFTTNYNAAATTVGGVAYAMNTYAKSYSLDAASVISTATPSATAGTAGAANFQFNTANGDLYFDSNGATAGGLVHIGHVDLATFTTAHSTGAAIDNTDFILVA